VTPPSADLLDDVDALDAGDPAGMLPAVASSAAQVREAAVLAGEADLARLTEEGRPRAVVVCGSGSAATAGDLLAAVAGTSSPVPLLVHRGPGCPPGSGRWTSSSRCPPPARPRRRSALSRRPCAAAAGCSW
jgi:hypothetical protein